MTKKQVYLTVFFGVILSLGLYKFLIDFNPNPQFLSTKEVYYQKKKDSLLQKQDKNYNADEKQLIEKLTEESFVIDYVKEYHELPDYYITISEAKKSGWIPFKGNLCDVLPNKAIGGDRFGNREKKLPQGQQYYEADVNYKCGRRNADRIVFNKKGEVWLTKDHYKTFIKR